MDHLVYLVYSLKSNISNIGSTIATVYRTGDYIAIANYMGCSGSYYNHTIEKLERQQTL
jgi:hypothetical protein